MAAGIHHRASFKATLNLRAEARFPAAAPLTATQSWELRKVVPKWCRWGYWEPDGRTLNVTRIL